MTALPLSAVFITCNSAKVLGPALESVAFVGDIVVVDSGSNDETVALAEAKGARVFQHEWLGFGAQKNLAISHARYDWVLCLDSDERVTPELALAIQNAITTGTTHFYAFPRRNFFLGRWLKHGEGYPDWSLRLFHRAHGQWSQDIVHEKVIATQPVGRLQGDLLHYSLENLGAYLEKQNRYTTLAAQAALARGHSASLAKIFISPWWRFFRMYILRAGFLDGYAGFVHIVIGCFNSFSKYAKLRELQSEKTHPPI